MAVQTQFMTIAEYVASDDPIEIADGEIIELSPNTRRQPHVVSNLMLDIGVFVKTNELGKVFAEASFVLDADPRTNWVKNARTPDVSFIARSRIEAHDVQYPDPDGPWRLAPDLAVEVISPTDEPQYVMQKLKDYLTYGVRIVWLVYPKTKTVVVYTPENLLGNSLTEADTLTAEPVIAGWSMPVAALFAE